MVTKQERLNDPEEAQRTVLDGRQVAIWTALPGIVTAVNLAAMTVEVQPTVQGKQKDDTGKITNVNMPVCPDVPICFPSAGGYTLTFPVKVGDECLIIFSSRSIDPWHQSGGVNPQIESRMHDLSDGFAIIGPKSAGKVLSNISADSVQLRNDAGTTFVDINDAGDMRLQSPTKITLDTPIVYFTGQIANIAGEYGGDFDATLQGNLHVEEEITSGGDTIAGTISLEHHTHSDSGGSGDGGPPIP